MGLITFFADYYTIFQGLGTMFSHNAMQHLSERSILCTRMTFREIGTLPYVDKSRAVLYGLFLLLKLDL